MIGTCQQVEGFADPFPRKKGDRLLYVVAPRRTLVIDENLSFEAGDKLWLTDEDVATFGHLVLPYGREDRGGPANTPESAEGADTPSDDAEDAEDAAEGDDTTPEGGDRAEGSPDHHRAVTGPESAR